MFKLLAKRLRIGKQKPVIIDFEDDYIILPNGDAIRREDIITYDAATGTIVYRAGDGSLRTLKILQDEEAGHDGILLAKLFEVAKRVGGEEKRDSGVLLYS